METIEIEGYDVRSFFDITDYGNIEGRNQYTGHRK